MKPLLAKRNKPAQMIFFITVMALVCLVLFSMTRILVPLCISYILYLIIKPLQRKFKMASFGRRVLMVAVVMLLLALVIIPFTMAISSIGEEYSKLRFYIPQLEFYLRTKYEVFQEFLQDRFGYALEYNLIEGFLDIATSSTKSTLVYIPQVLASLVEWGLLIPLFLFFMIKDSHRLVQEVLKIVPNSIVEKVYFILFRFNMKFGDYIFAKSLEALIIGLLITTGLLLIKFPFAFLLGIIAALTNIVPYLGPFIGFAPALIIGLAGNYDESVLVGMIFLYMVANFIDLVIVFPILVSKIVNLHPIVVVLSVIIGSQVWGVIGMILSIPAAAFVKILYIQIYSDLYGRSNSF